MTEMADLDSNLPDMSDLDNLPVVWTWNIQDFIQSLATDADDYNPGDEVSCDLLFLSLLRRLKREKPKRSLLTLTVHSNFQLFPPFFNPHHNQMQSTGRLPRLTYTRVSPNKSTI